MLLLMNLKSWQTQSKLKNKDLAQLFEVDQSYITYLLSGRRKPSPILAEKIERLTEGAVTRLELLYPE